jgi:hypothetical protein
MEKQLKMWGGTGVNSNGIISKIKTVTRELTTWSLRILALFSSSKLREHWVQRSCVTITGVPNIGAAPCAREIKQNYKDFFYT